MAEIRIKEGSLQVDVENPGNGHAWGKPLVVEFSRVVNQQEEVVNTYVFRKGLLESKGVLESGTAGARLSSAGGPDWWAAFRREVSKNLLALLVFALAAVLLLSLLGWIGTPPGGEWASTAFAALAGGLVGALTK